MKTLLVLGTLLAALSSEASVPFTSSAFCSSMSDAQTIMIGLAVKDETVMVHEEAIVELSFDESEPVRGKIKTLSIGPKATDFEIVSIPEGRFTFRGRESFDKWTYTLVSGDKTNSFKCSNSPLVILDY